MSTSDCRPFTEPHADRHAERVADKTRPSIFAHNSPFRSSSPGVTHRQMPCRVHATQPFHLLSTFTITQRNKAMYGNFKHGRSIELTVLPLCGLHIFCLLYLCTAIWWSSSSTNGNAIGKHCIRSKLRARKSHFRSLQTLN